MRHLTQAARDAKTTSDFRKKARKGYGLVDEKPVYRGILITILLSVFLAAVGVYFALPRLHQYDARLFTYAFYVFLGILAAVACFGVLRSSGKLRGEQFGSQFELGGAAALFALVVGGGMWNESQRQPSEFGFSIYLYENDNPNAVIKSSGELTLLLDERKTVTINQGYADVQRIPQRYNGRRVGYQLNVKGYSLIDPKSAELELRPHEEPLRIRVVSDDPPDPDKLPHHRFHPLGAQSGHVEAVTPATTTELRVDYDGNEVNLSEQGTQVKVLATIWNNSAELANISTVVLTVARYHTISKESVHGRTNTEEFVLSVYYHDAKQPGLVPDIRLLKWNGEAVPHPPLRNTFANYKVLIIEPGKYESMVVPISFSPSAARLEYAWTLRVEGSNGTGPIAANCGTVMFYDWNSEANLPGIWARLSGIRDVATHVARNSSYSLERQAADRAAGKLKDRFTTVVPDELRKHLGQWAEENKLLDWISEADEGTLSNWLGKMPFEIEVAIALNPDHTAAKRFNEALNRRPKLK